MKRVSTSAVALIAATFFAGTAGATDPYDARNDPAPDYANQHVTAVDWSGPYIGIGAGYSIANYELKGNGVPFNFDGIDSRGFQGCGIIGAQKQIGTFVGGLEGRGCGANTSTDVTFGGFNAGLSLDYSYAAYAKLGVANGDFLASVLAGYKWQHAKTTGALDGLYDDTIGGFSGGIVLENQLDDAGRWVIGLETLFSQFEQQDAVIMDIDPTQYEANIRLTYTVGK